MATIDRLLAIATCGLWMTKAQLLRAAMQLAVGLAVALRAEHQLFIIPLAQKPRHGHLQGPFDVIYLTGSASNAADPYNSLLQSCLRLKPGKPYC